MSEGKNLGLQRCTSLKDLPSRRKQRENDREHVAEKLQRRPSKFNQFSQNGVFGRDKYDSIDSLIELLSSELQLPDMQLETIRQTALEGVEQEIGRHSHSPSCIFTVVSFSASV